jgi:hypothetical protein
MTSKTLLKPVNFSVYDIAEILLKVELSTITQPLKNYFILRLAIK